MLGLSATARITPYVAPNPVVGDARLHFSTTRPGALHVAIFDVTGRRVRSVVNGSEWPAGLHVLPMDARSEGGSRLDSGVYFYRIRSVDGVSQGRFLIMR